MFNSDLVLAPLVWSLSFASIGFFIAKSRSKQINRGQMFSDSFKFGVYMFWVGNCFTFGLIVGLIHDIIKS